MYELDFSNCDADAVIRRSVVCHPSLLRDRLCDVARTHAEAAATMASADHVAYRVALDMCKAAQRLAGRLANSEELSELNFNERIIAFSAAARLQCIPPSVATDIIGGRR
jgi:hypothetical protein